MTITPRRDGWRDRAHAAVANADELRPLLKAADDFFAQRERECVDQMVNAKPEDDDTRRSAALRLNALRDFKTWIETKVRAGDNAALKLQRETQNAE